MDEIQADAPADEGDFTGTATGADGADNTIADGETFPRGDDEVGDGGPLGKSFDS